MQGVDTWNFVKNYTKKNNFPSNVNADYDDDDEEEEAIQQVVQPVQQVAQSPISSDPPAVIADEAVDNVDINSVSNSAVESDAKDPQQSALDQAATVNNSIDPTGSEAIIDDEDDGKYKEIKFYVVDS